MAYQALVDVASAGLIGDLRWWVYGWRLRRKRPTAGTYAPNRTEWTLYRGWLSRLAETHPVALLTDVVSYFASIPTARIGEDIARTAGGAVGTRIASMLEGWARTPGRSGIPQRSLASSALANRYLMSIDDELELIARQANPGRKFVTAVRWMDDMWIFGTDRGALRRGQVHLEAAFREMGLNMGSGKTKLLEGEDLVEASKRIEHSAVEAGLDSDPVDTEPLDELVIRLVKDPEVASRSATRFATRRIREKALWAYMEDFVEVADRMPQAADNLARLFRDGGAWRELGGWYVEHTKSAWGVYDWAVGHLGTMFPSNAEPPAGVKDYFEGVVSEHRSLPLAAVAAQRLAVWDADRARPLIRGAARSASDPLERRVLALSLVAAGERRDVVRALLQEFPENASTLAMLEATRFARPAVSADFG